ncbi:MAG: hypothetical protein QXO51_07410 [Halobacteria archaeon]
MAELVQGVRLEEGLTGEGGPGVSLYVAFARFCRGRLAPLYGDYREFARRAEARASGELKEALRLTALPLEPGEVLLAAYGAALLLAIPLLAAAAISALLALPGAWAFALGAALLPAAAMILLSDHPKRLARLQALRSLGDVPEITAYMVMALRLVPSLETAVRFAAESSDRSLARELRKALWDVGLRVHSTVEEGLAALGDRFGRKSESFRRALHLLRASTAEGDEAQRVMALNRALEVVLDGTRGLMEEMAERLRQPAMILFSVFVMIPLALVAMLPAAGVVGFRPGPAEVALLYLVLFPLATLLYSERTLRMRPFAHAPAPLPEDHPDLRSAPGARRSLAEGAFAGAAGGATALLLLPAAGLPPSAALLPGVAAGALLFSVRWALPRRRLRERIRGMEGELPDALLLLGRRIGEGRPPEEALQFASRTLEGGELAAALGDASGRLLASRTGLEGALLGPAGALGRVPSARVKALFRLFAVCVGKSPEAAGAAITRLADHLRELGGVEERMRRALAEVTSTMRTTSGVFAPLIGGVTVALSDTVGSILVRASTAAGLLEEGPPALAASPLTFDFLAPAAGLYLFALAALLVRFEGAVEEGSSREIFAHALGPRWALVAGVYLATLAVARGAFGGLAGP